MESRGLLTNLEAKLDRKGNAENILDASVYFILSGKTGLGEDVDNGRYPEVTPERFSDFLRRYSR